MNFADFFKEQIESAELALQVAPLVPVEREQADPWARESREGASVERWAPMVKPDLDEYEGFAR